MTARPSWLRAIRNRFVGHARPNTHTRSRLSVEPLEDRALPSGLAPAVRIYGEPAVAESNPYDATTSVYTLNLVAADPENDPVTGWTINWGDGTVEQVGGDPRTATHTYAAGSAVVRNVSASAVVGGETFTAYVSHPGEFVGEFPTNAGGVSYAGRIAFAPNGNLIVTGWNSNNVVAFDRQTGAPVGALITAADGLVQPLSLAVGSDGSVYVASATTSSVLKYDAGTGTVSTFIAAGNGGLVTPYAITLRSDGDLYVVSDAAGTVLRFDGDTGAFVGEFGTPVIGFRPGDGIAITFGSDVTGDGTGELFVAIGGGGQILHFDGATGAALGAFVPAGSGGLNNPQELQFGPDGDLYVASNGSGYILRYDGHTGEYLGQMTGHLEASNGLAFGPDGDMYVADLYPDRVLRYTGTLSTDMDTSLPVTVLDVLPPNTYSSSPKATIPSDLKTYSWSITVPNAGQVVDVDVALDITHKNDSDLMVWLVSPSGQRVRLIDRVGGTGDNFKGTILDDEAATSITAGSAPFTGRFRPQNPLSNFDGEQAQGTWTLQISDRTKPDKGTLNSWSLTITRGVGPALMAAATPTQPTATGTLTTGDVQHLLAEAVRRWEAAGEDTSGLANLDVRILDLGGATLGMASGSTIWLDDDAAGWGWFLDPTPGDDGEFLTPGDQGEQGRMDLLSALMHEIGHVLGHDHDEGGTMAETLAAGSRLTVGGAYIDSPGWFLAPDEGDSTAGPVIGKRKG